MSKKSLDDLARCYYNDERPVGIIVDVPVVIQQAVNAARYFATFGAIESLLSDGALLGADSSDPSNIILGVNPVPAVEWIDQSTALTMQEWGCIKSLFMLYVERESAVLLEASRTLGADVYGRQTSEIAQEIAQVEQDIPQLAFFQPIISI